MQQFQQQLHQDLPPTTLWGFEGLYPGPTIEVTRDVPITVRWINDLRDSMGNLRTQHYLPVDLCMHGPDHAGNTPRTVVHLHGGHVPAAFDGYPESTFLPGEDDLYYYPNNQQSATIWYHDHALGITRLNVYMGLAAFYLVRDAFEQGLGLPSGEFEIPIVIQDRRFNPDGTLQYPATWEEHFFGDKILVNGKVWPLLNVKQGKYRFRLLNGSNSRTYTLALSNGGTITQIGTDGGLLPAPVPLAQLTITPGERADLILDFEGIAAGTEILLTNSAPAPYPGTPGVGVVPEVMKFVVTSESGDTTPIPPALRPIEILDENDATQFRDFVLRKQSEPCAGNFWLINDLGWDDITEYPVLGETEVWSFINQSGIVHPMHMHLVFFQILDRQPFEVIGGVITPTGPRVPPAPNEAGWKDTVQTNPMEITRVIARFEDYTGKFAYHCHILEHEDHEMMRQFEVVLPGGADAPQTRAGIPRSVTISK
jgi:spore coat protein A